MSVHYLEHCRPLFNNLQRSTLSSMHILESAIQVLRCPETFKRSNYIYKYYRHKSCIRRNKDVLMNSHRTSALSQSEVLHSSSKVFNKIPEEITKLLIQKHFRKINLVSKTIKHPAHFEQQKYYYSIFTELSVIHVAPDCRVFLDCDT